MKADLLLLEASDRFPQLAPKIRHDLIVWLVVFVAASASPEVLARRFV
jgi:hypothetical protein